MTTVINNPGNGEGSDSAVSVLILVLVLVAAIALFFIYVLPAMRDDREAPRDNSVNIDLQLPPPKTQDSSTPGAY